MSAERCGRIQAGRPYCLRELPGKPMKVLIVDDSKAMQNIIAKSMKSIGYQKDEYLYCSDGAQALKLILRERPDLVLCDMHMPTRSGLELLQELRAANDNTRVIIVSIDDDKALVEKVRSLGGQAYLKKPFTGKELFATVTEVVGKALPKVEESEESEHSRQRRMLPDLEVLERVLGALAGSDVICEEVPYGELDFDLAPFYGSTFQDSGDNVVMALFMDVVAANTIAAILNRQPLSGAAGKQALDAADRQVLLSFLGVFAALSRSQAGGQPLEIHAEQFAANPREHLKSHLDNYSATALVISLGSGSEKVGKLVIIFTA